MSRTAKLRAEIANIRKATELRAEIATLKESNEQKQAELENDALCDEIAKKAVARKSA